MTLRELIKQLEETPEEYRDKPIVLSNIRDYPFVHGPIKEFKWAEEGPHYLRLER